MDAKKNRLLFVDGLRGIAACLVMLFHFEFRLDGFTITGGYGNLGVPIFFVLSGFVIAMTITGKSLSLPFLGRFALRRAIRLDVPYWASMALLIFVALFGSQFGVKQSVPDVPQVLSHLIYAQDLLGYEPIASVYWSLCYEIQFYLALVLLLIGMERLALSERSRLIVMGGLIVLSLLERGPLLDIAPKGLALVFWYTFALGSLTYWVHSKRVDRRVLFAAQALVLLHAALFGDAFAYAAVSTSVALYLAGRYGYMHRWLSGPVFQFLGKTSYSLYIFHNIIGWYALSFAIKYVNQFAALGIGITAALVSAWLSYLLIERPSIALSRKVRLEPKLELAGSGVQARL